MVVKVKARKDIDVYEDRIRDEAVEFSVVPMLGTQKLARFQYKDRDTAIAGAEALAKTVPGLRTVIIYAIDKNERYVMFAATDDAGNVNLVRGKT